MRDPARIPRICKLLEDWWESNPDARLGQLIECLARVYVNPECGHGCIFNIEDTRWEELLKINLWERYGTNHKDK
jgi:hypothetical protein